MSLLSPQDREVVRQQLAGITHPVKLLLFTQSIGAPDSVAVAKQVLNELDGLNEHITVEEVNAVLDKDKAAQYGVDRIPAVVLLRGEEDTRMRFLGAPAGYEFVSLVTAVALAGSDDSGLGPAAREMIAGVKEPIDIQVFVTPT